MSETWISRIGEWAARLRIADVPADVVDLSRRQTASVLGACFAADVLPASRAWRRMLAGLSPGEVAAAPFGDRVDAPTACGITAGLSVALDFDDYLFLGHTGHSAVACSLVLGAHLGASAETALLAQVIANETAGRIGASVVLGPHNGQLWSFIHAAGASLAAAKLLALDETQTAHALALAMAAPPYPFFASLMGPDSKLMLVADATASGVRSAYLAQAGITGPLGALDDPKGFYSGFAFAPLRTFLGGLGRSWITHTLAFKPYPGCAYIDSTIDALLEITARVRDERGRDLAPDEVVNIDVAASLLTTQMESLGRAFAPAAGMPPLFNLAFRIPHNAAIAILAGCLTPRELAPVYIAEHRDAILALASRVRLRHDMGLSLGVARALLEGLAPFSSLTGLRWKDLRRARREAKVRLAEDLPLGWSMLAELLRTLTWEDLSRLYRRRRTSTGTMDDVDFRRVRFPFAARVSLRTRDGKIYEAARDVPDGAPGGRDRTAIPERKFMQEAAPVLGEPRARAALDAILAGRDGRTILESLKTGDGS